MQHLFNIDYRIKTTSLNNGEYSSDHVGAVYTHVSVSNDVGEVFADLVDLHREDNLIGLEIISVERQ